MSKVIKKAPLKTVDENTEILIKELIELFEALGYSVRIDKGLFKGGFCLLREQKLFLLNKSIEQSKKVNILLKNLGDIGIEGIFVKPNIREMIEKAAGSD